MELDKNRIWNLNYTFSKWKIYNNGYKFIYLKPVSFIMQFIQNNLFKTAYLKQYYALILFLNNIHLLALIVRINTTSAGNINNKGNINIIVVTANITFTNDY